MSEWDNKPVCKLVTISHLPMQNTDIWDIYLFVTNIACRLVCKEYAYTIVMSFCFTSVSDEIGCKSTAFPRYVQINFYFFLI